jgi:hypothetical protein
MGQPTYMLEADFASDCTVGSETSFTLEHSMILCSPLVAIDIVKQQERTWIWIAGPAAT